MTAGWVAHVPDVVHGHRKRAADLAGRDLARQTRDADLSTVSLHQALQRLGWKVMATHLAAEWFQPNHRVHRVWAGALGARVRRLAGGGLPSMVSSAPREGVASGPRSSSRDHSSRRTAPGTPTADW